MYRKILIVFLLNSALLINGQDALSIINVNQLTEKRNIADTLFAHKKFYEASQYYKFIQKEQRKINDNELIFKLAACYKETRQYQEALNLYKRLYLKDSVNYPLALFYQAQMLEALDEFADAAIKYQQFRDRVYFAPESYFILAKNRKLACEISNLQKEKFQSFVLMKANEVPINKYSVFSAFIKNNDICFLSTNKDNTKEVIELPGLKGIYNEFYKNKAQCVHTRFKNSSELLIPLPDSINNIHSLHANGAVTIVSLSQKEHHQLYVYHNQHLIKLTEPINTEKSNSLTPFVYSTGSGYILLFSNNRNGNYNLYYAFLSNDFNIVTMAPFGSEINNSYNQICPTYNEESNKLYYSSNEPSGRGNYDIYKANGLLGNAFDSVQCLEFPINSGADDYFFYPIDDKHQFALLTSNRSSLNAGYKDNSIADRIYRVEKRLTLKDSQWYQLSLETNTVSTGVAYVLRNGYYYDSSEYHNTSTIELNIPTTGNNTIILISKGNMPFVLDINEEPDELFLQKISRTVNYDSLRKGKSFILERLQFETDSFSILPSSIPELERLSNFLQLNPTVSIQITGHTDDRGDPMYNIKLSQLRAKTVATYLLNQGIAEFRLSIQGKGSSQPLVPNTDEYGKTLNRRVVVTLIN